MIAIAALAPVIAACQTDSPGYYRDYAWNDDDYSGWGWGGYDRDRSDAWRYRRHRDWNDRDHDRNDRHRRDRGDRDDHDNRDNPWRRVDRNRDHDHDRHDSSRFARSREDRNYGGGHQDNRPRIVIPRRSRDDRD